MRKNVIRGYKMIDAGDISANVTSSEVNVINLDKASVFVSWTGTSPVGELKVEAKNADNGTWFELDMGGPISISGNSGNHTLLFNELPHNTIRILYVWTSGSGSLNAVLAAKQVGG